MFSPNLLPRVKQQHNRSGHRINSREIWPLLSIALRAREAKIFDMVVSLVLRRNDMIDVETELPDKFRNQTVLAPAFRASDYQRPLWGVCHVRPPMDDS